MDKKGTMQIDIDTVLEAKAKDKARLVPRFVVRLLKKLVHQDEINMALRKHGDCDSISFAYNIIHDTLGCSYEVHGLEDVPVGGRYVFVSNHPLGGLDGMALIACTGKRFGEVRFVVNDLLMFLEPLAPVFIPVNKFGSMKQDNAKALNDAFRGDAQMLYFPAGLCSRMNGGKIADPQWKSTFVKKAREYGRDIVPVYFEGRNSGFFYRLARLRKKLGIKFNIEMMFLPDEMFRQKGRSFGIYFGKPIPIASLDGSKSPAQWAEHVREICYNLKPQQ